MKPKYCFMAMLLPLLFNQAPAQTTAFTTNINSPVPDALLHMTAYKQPTAKLSSFNNKLLILDFWATACTSCAHHFAELDALQQQFKNEIMILPVDCASTLETKATVDRFIKGYRSRVPGGFNFPSVINDTMLQSLFPHPTLGYFVWINKGVYVGGTYAEDVTAENITQVLHTNELHVKQQPKKVFYDLMNPLQQYSSDATILINGKSLLTAGIDSFESSWGLTHNDITGPKLYVINSTVTGLYKIASKELAYVPSNQVINETGSFMLAPKENAGHQPIFCYELVAKGINDETMFKRMEEDLCAYFKVKGTVEDSVMQCLVLQTIDSNMIAKGNGIEGNTLYDDITGERTMINQPLSELAERLNRTSAMPVVDETGITRTANLKLPNNLADVAAMNEYVKKQGLLLKEETRHIQVLVLRNVNEEDTIKVSR